MPSYDYLCPSCRQRSELRHAMDAAAPRCGVCGTILKRVVLSAPAVHGRMARGREAAMRSLGPGPGRGHGKGCPCCH